MHSLGEGGVERSPITLLLMLTVDEDWVRITADEWVDCIVIEAPGKFSVAVWFETDREGPACVVTGEVAREVCPAAQCLRV